MPIRDGAYDGGPPGERFDEGFLLNRFRAFHADLIAARDSIPGEQSDAAEWLCQHLASQLGRDTVAARRLGGALAEKLCAESGFIAAVLADEILLHGPDWAGRRHWPRTLLESRAYRSYDGGESFFRRLDAVLASPDPVQRQLAPLFLLALRLGFLGRYRGEPDAAAAIDQYSRRLFEVMANRAPAAAHPSRPLAPQAYAHTVSADRIHFLPYIGGWGSALLGYLATFLLLSWLAWHHEMAPVMEIVDKPPATARGGG